MYLGEEGLSWQLEQLGGESQELSKKSLFPTHDPSASYPLTSVNTEVSTAIDETGTITCLTPESLYRPLLPASGRVTGGLQVPPSCPQAPLGSPSTTNTSESREEAHIHFPSPLTKLPKLLPGRGLQLTKMAPNSRRQVVRILEPGLHH